MPRCRHTHWSLLLRGVALLAVMVMPGRSAYVGSEKTPAPSGRVQYRMTSPSMHGTMTLSWTDNGRKYRQDIRGITGSGGQKTPIETWTIGDGSYVYSYQFEFRLIEGTGRCA